MNTKYQIEKIKSIINFFNKENKILKEGLGEFYNLVIWYIPFILGIILFSFSYILNTNLETYTDNLISILPSLIGFLIASATILITIDSDTIDKIHNGSKYSYRQIGGSVFFYATKISIILLLFSFISTDTLTNTLNCYIYTFLSILVVLYFSKLIISILYGLMFLTSTIETIKTKEEE
jgi:hypothetical protein